MTEPPEEELEDRVPIDDLIHASLRIQELRARREDLGRTLLKQLMLDTWLTCLWEALGCEDFIAGDAPMRIHPEFPDPSTGGDFVCFDEGAVNVAFELAGRVLQGDVSDDLFLMHVSDLLQTELALYEVELEWVSHPHRAGQWVIGVIAK